MVKNEFLFYKFQVFIKYLKMTTNKFKDGTHIKFIGNLTTKNEEKWNF
jgi:hypothetical protein